MSSIFFLNKNYRGALFVNCAIYKAPGTANLFHKVVNKQKMRSQISDFYKNQTIFITGGTGFLGKILVEKVLRVSYDIKRIYILIRAKKGKSVDERLQEFLRGSCFDRLREERPFFKEKITAIAGDCEFQNLGISDAEILILTNEVTCVIHSAATLKFNEGLRKAAFINIRAVRDLMKIAKKCRHLKAFLHISTAYSNCPRNEIKEIFYDPPMSADNLFALLQLLSDDFLEKITPALLGDYPNSYTFTKNIAESVIKAEAESLPIAIFRPSIIFTAVDDPFPGFSDTLQGFLAISVAAYVGLAHVTHAKSHSKFNIVPVDYSVNSALAIAWNVEKNQKIKIYNYALSDSKSISWLDYRNICIPLVRKFPTNVAIWYPFMLIFETAFLAEFCVFFVHFLPAYVLDFFLKLFQKKPLFVRLYKKIDEGQNLLFYFMSKSWRFNTENSDNLWSKMSENDRQMFKFNTEDLDWCDYFKNGLFGVRKFILKDPPETLAKAKRRQFAFLMINYAVLFAVLLIFYKCIFG